MELTEIEYSYGGRRFIGQLACDDVAKGRRPAVLVCHEGNGISEHSTNAARRLAERGYVAFALDYYGDGKVLESDEMMPRINELASDPELTRAIGSAGLDVLLASEYADPARVAAIGFCLGGTMALELARVGTDLAAAVGFHSGLATSQPASAGSVTAKVLVNIGADDPFVPPDQRTAFEDEMRTAGADWQMNVYGGCAHSFTNPSADGTWNPDIKYEPTAARRSWQAMLELFDEVF